ncbi:MAG: transposase [Betaproteobacteria bacterium HGW-Betaproteobacteria-20]|nr:MAG: transposase [Betaproteobacteria bacterium HGW-Betaproteobacteria-20]
MDFVAIDVETANSDMASICQIGIAKFSNGVLVEEWVSLLNPEDYFHFINIDIHGIDENDVVDAPKFSDVLYKLKYFMDGSICICHTHFDRVSIAKAFQKYSIQPLNITWLDSARVARRTWEEFAWSGYGLANVCRKIGYEFNHHDALEDAKASGQVVLAAIKESKLDLDMWVKRVKQPINFEYSSQGAAIQRIGNPEGDLNGEVVVFTGALQMPRNEAADLASKIGCNVAPGVTKETTLLVVGDQDIAKFAGKEKSAKHIKAEQLIAKGYGIRIIQESDFNDLIESAQQA